MKKKLHSAPRTSDALFQLVKTLTKAEKRNFKLFVGRNSSSGGDLKVAQLFDLLDKLPEYDEAVLVKKSGAALRKEQLHNLKANLYRQILASLRIMREEVNVENQLHEQLEYARILYDKGLYQQSLRMLERTRETAKHYHQYSFWLQALVFEKKIESLHITRSMRHRAEEIALEVRLLNEQLAMVGRLSNLALQLYSRYIYYGHTRNARDAEALTDYFNAQLPVGAHQATGFFEKMYLYQCYCWYAFISQDFLLYYRYASKWAGLFEVQPQMLRVEAPFYIKALHNLLMAHFMLRNHKGYAADLAKLTDFSNSENGTFNENVQALGLIYRYIGQLNGALLLGDFQGGLGLVPALENDLKHFAHQIDRHRELVFYYKIACLYFTVGNFEKTLDYLHRIIHWNVDLRNDLQCYARLLHLIAHYELGNTAILEHLIKSVYRFMAKMEHLSVVEEEIFRFIRKSFQLTGHAQVKAALANLLERLRRYENSPYEGRSFMYLDVIGWLESKTTGNPLESVIRARMRQKP